MGARFECTTEVAAPIGKLFDLSRSIDAHTGSMSRFREQAVAGVTRGMIGLDQEVTWRARHFGVTWTMTSRITEFDRPHRFVDQQVRGPFARFRHEHRFEAIEGGTIMVDVVTLTPPFGLLGEALQPLLMAYVKYLIMRRNTFLKEAAEADSKSLPGDGAERPIWKHAAGTIVDGVPKGTGGTGGSVSIYPGRILLTVDPSTVYFHGVREVLHTDPVVRVRFALQFFPLSNVAMILEGKTRTVAAVFPPVYYRSLLRALREAGFQVQTKMTLSIYE